MILFYTFQLEAKIFFWYIHWLDYSIGGSRS